VSLLFSDIGTGDSDFTWQAMAGLGYQFNWGDVVLTYRYLDYDLGSASSVTDPKFSGVMLGASFSW
jgi:opacity protein-like surface antigen